MARKNKVELGAAAGSPLDAAAAAAAEAFVSGAHDAPAKRGRPRVNIGAETTRLNVEIAASQMIGLKRRALDQDMTLKELLADMIDHELQKD